MKSIFNKDSYIDKLKKKIKEIEEVNKYYVGANKKLKEDMAENNEQSAALQKELNRLIEYYKSEIDKVKKIKEDYNNLIYEVKLLRKELKNKIK